MSILSFAILTGAMGSPTMLQAEPLSTTVVVESTMEDGPEIVEHRRPGKKLTRKKRRQRRKMMKRKKRRMRRNR